MRKLLVAVVSLVAGGCGADGVDVSSARGDGRVEYEVAALVLEAPGHGPQLCLSGVMESYPPQCGGPRIVGWDWASVDGEESVNGTIWGEFDVVGTWDGQELTVTAPPQHRETSPPRRETTQFRTPCEPPAGGWRVVDEAKTTDASLDAATSYARSQPGVGGVWLDQSINPAFDDEGVEETAMNDPTRLVLNISFTRNLSEHERALRAVWGGALCVSKATRSAAELERIRSRVVAESDGVLASGTNEVAGHVFISVAVDDGLQRRLDRRYGKDVVRVHAHLRPVSG